MNATTQEVRTCQICARNIKANTGVIAHHEAEYNVRDLTRELERLQARYDGWVQQ